jgi:hypothetical protein
MNKKPLTVDGEYLTKLEGLSTSNRNAIINRDITDQLGGIIDLKPPLGTRLMGLYSDVRDYIIAMNHEGSYDIQTHREYDAEVVSGISLGNLKNVGDGLFRLVKKHHMQPSYSLSLNYCRPK